MKRMLLLLCCLYSFYARSQSTILQAKLPAFTSTRFVIDSSAFRGIDSLKNAMTTVRKNKGDSASLSQFTRALYNNSISSFKAVDSLKKHIKNAGGDSVKAIRRLAQTDSSTKVLDSIAKTDIKPKEVSFKDTIQAYCSNLINFSIKYIAGDNDAIIGVVEDSTGNAMQSFTILQPNKELFYDKLKKALQAICTNTSVTDTLMAQYRRQDPDLYTQFLEKKNDLENTNGLAGILKIHKKVPVHYMSMDKLLKDARDSGSKATIDSSVAAAKATKKPAKKSAVEILQARLDSMAQVLASRNQPPPIAAAPASAKDSSRRPVTDTTSGRVRANAAATASTKDGILLLPKVRDTLPVLTKPNPADTPASASTTILGKQSVREHIRQQYPDSQFRIQDIQIQFQDDFIENIKIQGKFKGNNHLFRFENIYPIGFSTKRDFRNLIDMRLYEKSDYHQYSDMYLVLGEVLYYSMNLSNHNKDYSPADQTLTINAVSDSVKEISLYKDQTSKILELQVYSDLKGADNGNPNGLIQLELNKKLNFFSKRYPMSWKFLPWHWLSKRSFENIANFGLFNYITPQFSLDKIENNEKRFIVDHIDTLTLSADTSRSLTYVSTINLLRHQIYRVGFDLSCFLLDVPSIKSTFDFGWGLHFGRTALQDTFRIRQKIDSAHFLFQAAPSNNVRQYGINTFQWGPYLTWQIFPDSRFSVAATQRFTWFKALSNEIVQVRDSAQYLKFIAHTPKAQIGSTNYPYYDYGSSNWFVKNLAKPFSLFTKCIASTEIYAYFSPNSDGSNKLFFRYRINWDLANSHENYHQMQVGFSTYLTATKEYNKLKKAANFD